MSSRSIPSKALNSVIGSPNALFRRGVTQKTLAIGTEVLVDGYRAKDGSKMANGSKVTLADGRQVFAGSTADGSPTP